MDYDVSGWTYYTPKVPPVYATVLGLTPGHLLYSVYSSVSYTHTSHTHHTHHTPYTSLHHTHHTYTTHHIHSHTTHITPPEHSRPKEWVRLWRVHMHGKYLQYTLAMAVWPALLLTQGAPTSPLWCPVPAYNSAAGVIGLGSGTDAPEISYARHMAVMPHTWLLHQPWLF